MEGLIKVELRRKGRYYDKLVDKALNTTFRETAKELGVGERALTQLLLDMKYIYRDRRGRLMPYAPNDGKLFAVKECLVGRYLKIKGGLQHGG